MEEIAEVTSYGVQIPGREECGRAGMVTIVVKEGASLDLKSLYSLLETQLPPFAHPCFVRISDSIVSTGTFKHNKAVLRQEGFNLQVVKDKIFFLHPSKKEYVPFDEQLQSQLLDFF